MSTPKRADVKTLVVRTVATLSGFEETAVTERRHLHTDLGLTGPLRRALAPGFRAIARKWNPDAHMTMKECGKLGTVGDAVDLVHERAKEGEE